MPKLQNALWDQLIAEFPPLWNPQDLCFRDLHVRNQCRQLLLEKANRVSSVPITMDAVRKKLRYLNKRLRKGSSQESGSEPLMFASTNPDSTQPLANRICIRELAAEYPCLWDSSDVNYLNALMKKNCEDQLLVKYNNLASTPITMLQLREKLQDLSEQWSGPTETQEPEEMRPPSPPSIRRLEDLVKEFPCLSDRKSPGYFNWRMKKIALTRLLAMYNSTRPSNCQINYFQLRSMVAGIRRKRTRVAAAGRRSEDTRADAQSDLGNSSDSTDQANLNNQAGETTPLLSIVFHCCAVCGEVRSECLNHNDKSYIENNKTTLILNSLSVELNYDNDATVCQNCDKKLKEMHEFVKLVKNAQDKMNGINIADVITLDDDDNDDQKLIIDSVTVTDTEVTPTVSNKRKSEETPEMKKKCRVTIDLNSCNEDRSMDDIAKYRMFKNDGLIVDSNDPEKVLKVIGTGYGEDITFDVKEEVDTDDIHDEVDETGDINADDDKSKIVIADARTCNSEYVIKQKEADDILKNAETSNTVTHEEKKNDIGGNGEVVNKEDNRNGGNNDHTNDSEITSVAASIVNALASKEPVCVMPKSELIGLVESIVTRMMNK